MTFCPTNCKLPITMYAYCSHQFWPLSNILYKMLYHSTYSIHLFGVINIDSIVDLAITRYFEDFHDTTTSPRVKPNSLMKFESLDADIQLDLLHSFIQLDIFYNADQSYEYISSI